MSSYDLRSTVSYNDVFNENHIVNFFGGMELNATDRSKVWFNGAGSVVWHGYAFQLRPFVLQVKATRKIHLIILLTKPKHAKWFFRYRHLFMEGRYTVNGTVRTKVPTNQVKPFGSAGCLHGNISVLGMRTKKLGHSKLNSITSNLTLKASYSLTADRGPAFVVTRWQWVNSYNPWRPNADVMESGLGIYKAKFELTSTKKKYELNLIVDLGFLDNRIKLQHGLGTNARTMTW